MSQALEFLWYIPNEVSAGHRGDTTIEAHNSLDVLTSHARALEDHGWTGALIGTGWGRPDTFTVAAALAARTTRFEPLIAVRPGYWRPANFASAAATLDHLTGGRVRINIVSGKDNLAAYGDSEGDQAHRYGRTREFMRLVRRLWTEENVSYQGEHFQVAGSTVMPRIVVRGERRHPKLYFGGASEAAEQTAAAEADIQLFWGEPLDGVAERIARLKALSKSLDRDLPPLEFGLRITTFVRDTTEEAWRDAEAKVAQMAAGTAPARDQQRVAAVGQQRLLALQSRGDVLDDNLYTAPGKFGGGGAGTTWLVGSAEDVARSLRKYQDLGITHFVLSDTPYLAEIRRQGQHLLPLLPRLTRYPLRIGIDRVGVFDASIEIFTRDRRLCLQYDTPYIRHLPTRLTSLATEGDELQRLESRPSFRDPYTSQWLRFHETLAGGAPFEETLEDAGFDLALAIEIAQRL